MSTGQRAAQAVAALAAGTPLIAMLQGAFLLQEYRHRHGQQSFPDSPSRGVVVASRQASYQKPLRVLVIGDSLAAGVGTTQQSTPVLPEALAKYLSLHTHRPVHWTCVGTPGLSSVLIVQEILHLPQLPPLTDRLIEWQKLQRKQVRRRLGHVKDQLHDWWHQRHDDNNNPESPSLWDRLRSQPPPRPLLDVRISSTTTTQPPDNHLLERPHDYDIAVVLTGINDLKDSFLPFMMTTNTPTATSTTTTTTPNTDSDFRSTLVRLTRTLQERLLKKPPPLTTTTSVPQQQHTPLIVVPALPVEPLSMTRLVPLSWFLTPILHDLDEAKLALQRSFPNLVLFVPQPPDDVGSLLRLVAADGIHPNDQGYRLWGNVIGEAIVARWNGTM